MPIPTKNLLTPYLGKIVKLMVLRNHLGVEMAVVVYYGLMLRRCVIELARGVVCQHEVVVYEHLLIVMW